MSAGAGKAEALGKALCARSQRVGGVGGAFGNARGALLRGGSLRRLPGGALGLLGTHIGSLLRFGALAGGVGPGPFGAFALAALAELLIRLGAHAGALRPLVTRAE